MVWVVGRMMVGSGGGSCRRPGKTHCPPAPHRACLLPTACPPPPRPRRLCLEVIGIFCPTYYPDRDIILLEQCDKPSLFQVGGR